MSFDTVKKKKEGPYFKTEGCDKKTNVYTYSQWKNCTHSFPTSIKSY